MITQEIKKYTKGVINLNFKHELILSVVESFLYSKTKPILLKKYVNLNSQFSQKLKKIQTQSIKNVLDFLDIKNSFRLQKLNVNENSYSTAINELDKLRFFDYPFDKLVN